MAKNKKTADEITPAILIHPGEMIKDELEARGMTQKDLANKLGISYTVFNEVLNGKRPVSTELALMLEALWGIDAHIWLKLQANYNMGSKRKDKAFMQHLQELKNMAAASLL